MIVPTMCNDYHIMGFMLQVLRKLLDLQLHSSKVGIIEVAYQRNR